ncbi:hypothetical protein [Rhodoplanes sp. Z2-YC6860]|uniref:hypothetical protein n=1 Tax=Rhodoplanes sp. Z2-YC6860 TaxID=674703 RepID=UPI000829C272|nr:hypothetical protein [Rhodoplanes sp. Z2-YC6860]
MSGKGAHINILGERIRRYYEHLMTDAHTFVDELRKDLEGPQRQSGSDLSAKPDGTSAPDAAARPAKRSH